MQIYWIVKRTRKAVRLNSLTEVRIVWKTGRLEVCAKNRERERELNQSETREEKLQEEENRIE